MSVKADSHRKTIVCKEVHFKRLSMSSIESYRTDPKKMVEYQMYPDYRNCTKTTVWFGTPDDPCQYSLLVRVVIYSARARICFPPKCPSACQYFHFNAAFDRFVHLLNVIAHGSYVHFDPFSARHCTNAFLFTSPRLTFLPS